jgi:hypothetical protein
MLTNVSKIGTASIIAMMMEAVRTSETGHHQLDHTAVHHKKSKLQI